MAKTDSRLCRYCKRSMEPGASVCAECGREQKYWLQYFGNLSVLVSIVMMLLAFYSLLDARKETNLAQETASRLEDMVGHVVGLETETKNKLARVEEIHRVMSLLQDRLIKGDVQGVEAILDALRTIYLTPVAGPA